MDEAVKTSTMHSLRTAGLTALLALAAGAAAAAAATVAGHAGAPSAQTLPDPTRPPAAAIPAAATAAAAPAAVPQLQSVLVGPVSGARRIAVIDGESVRVGESFHGARVVRIADNEVELQRGRERQVLRLYAPEGAGGMTRVAPAADGRAERRAKGEQ